MNKLRVAVVGAGNIARNYHLPSLRRLADEGAPIELAAVCDVQPERAQAMATRFGFARALSDYRALLDAVAPDAVWALVPYPIMREVAGFYLAHGMPVLMEKPPGVSSQETRELLLLAETHGTPHQVAFNRRYWPLLLKMKALLGEVGPPHALLCQFYRYHRTEPHFAFGTGVHGLDALRFLADSEVVEVHARAGSHGSAQITLVMANGALGLMEMLPQVGVDSERYTAHAGERTVAVDGAVAWLAQLPAQLQCFDARRLTQAIAHPAGTEAPEVAHGFYGESAAFFAALRAGQRPGPDLRTALRSVEIAEAVDQGRSLVFD
ncbi:MAG: Gfo/Idh/MocA family oxidoreductase [Chloroflexota bacterium]